MCDTGEDAQLRWMIWMWEDEEKRKTVRVRRRRKKVTNISSKFPTWGDVLCSEWLRA
jgi:hypothetical protein